MVLGRVANMWKIFSVAHEKKHILLKILGIKIRVQYGVDKKRVEEFIQHEVIENTI